VTIMGLTVKVGRVDLGHTVHAEYIR